MKFNLEDECIHYQASRKTRKTETDRGENHNGTMRYEQTGCYECDGFNFDCERYISLKKLMDF